MIIYPLPPQELDDLTLKRQIKAIAQTILSVHYYHLFYTDNNPTDSDLHNWQTINKGWFCKDNFQQDAFFKWASECRANYNALVKMGLACCEEWEYRFNDIKIKGGTHYVLDNDPDKKKIKYNRHKLQPVVEWARDNVPDLPDGKIDEDCKNKGYQDSCDYNPCDIHAWGSPTPFPLVMSEEYIEDAKITNPESWGHVSNVVYAYRKYYCSKLSKDAKWTRREKPNWLK
jgi:hypothetical protein